MNETEERIRMVAPLLSTELGWLITKETPNALPLIAKSTSASTPPFPEFDFESERVVVRCLCDESSNQIQFENKEMGEVRVTVSPADYKRLQNKWKDFIKRVDRFPLMNKQPQWRRAAKKKEQNCGVGKA